ncbi:MAG: FecR family protein [Lentisphaeraceae bacterium]|nr:FecR family protein [Lentisphaeraceae bacterium]
MSENEQLEDFLSKLISEDLSDADVAQFKELSRDNPEVLKELAETLAMTELVSQTLQEERSSDCFTASVTSSIKAKERSKTRDQKFVDSVKKRIQHENKKKNSSKPNRKTVAKFKKSKKKKSKGKFFFFLAAAAALIISGIVTFMPKKEVQTIPELVILEGELKNGNISYKEGDAVVMGTLLRTYQKSARLKFKDGSIIKVGKGSMFSFNNDSSRKVLLTNGRIDAVITPQKKTPIYFETPFTVAEIIGTEFTLWAENWRDVLVVHEGRVHFRSLHTEKSYFVNGGENTTVYRGGQMVKKRKADEIPPIRRLLLIKRDTGKILQEITKDTTIDFSKYGKDINIVAEVERNVKVVIFVVNGKIVSEEVKARYIPHGNSFANIMPWDPRKGRWSLRMIPYHENGKLLAERKMVLTFK